MAFMVNKFWVNVMRLNISGTSDNEFTHTDMSDKLACFKDFLNIYHAKNQSTLCLTLRHLSLVGLLFEREIEKKN